VAAPVIMGARYRGRPIYFSDPTARVLHPSTFEVSNHTIRL